jgi:hypothetical protein
MALTVAYTVLSQTYSYGELEPMIIEVSSVATGCVQMFTVPANKVFVASNIQPVDDSMWVVSRDGVQITNSAYSVGVTSKTRLPAYPGIHIPEGWVLSAGISEKPTKINFFGCMASPSDIYGGSPLIVCLDSSSSAYVNTYVVPTNSYLVIQQAMLVSGVGAVATLDLSNGNHVVEFILSSSSIDVSGSFIGSLLGRIPPNTIIPSGWQVAVKKPMAGTARICLYALLASRADLYAALPSVTAGFGVKDGVAEAVQRLPYSRPVAFLVQQSQDLRLGYWSPVDVSSVYTSNRQSYAIYWPLEPSADPQFFRITARCRR